MIIRDWLRLLRLPNLATAAADQGVRWAPVVAPTGQGGALMGLTVAF